MQLQLVERGAWEDNHGERGEAPDLGIVKSIVSEARHVPGHKQALDFVISSARRDRDNDVIKVDGWDTKQWEQNPVVLWSHSHGEPPVAKGFNLRTKKGKVLCSAEFMSHDLNPFADMIYRMYQQGFLKATSVGFRPLKWNRLPDEKESADGDFTQMPGFEFEKQELLEWSTVPVGANPDALIRAAEAKIDLRPMREWCERFLSGDRIGKSGITRDEVAEAWKACGEQGFWIEVENSIGDAIDEVMTNDMPLGSKDCADGEPIGNDVTASTSTGGVIPPSDGPALYVVSDSGALLPDPQTLKLAVSVPITAKLTTEGEYEIRVDDKLIAKLPQELLAAFPDGLVELEAGDGDEDEGDDEEEETGSEEGEGKEEDEAAEESPGEESEAPDSGDESSAEGSGNGGAEGADASADTDELEIDFGDEDDGSLDIDVGTVEELRSAISSVLVEELSKALNE